MLYFAGPIELTTEESQYILQLMLLILLICLFVLAIFIVSIRKAAKQLKLSNTRLKLRDNSYSALTLKLPIATVIAFLAWFIASMSTKEARYTSDYANIVSSIFGRFALLLFFVSLIVVIANLYRK